MRMEKLPAEEFLRHRGLILAAAGGAVAEGGLLTLAAPAARALAPQVTALPSIAAYHDLRWLFTDSQSWLWFAGLVAALLIVRSALDAALLRLAWPRGVPPPPLGRSFASCAALTALAWLLLTPAATLAFGVAVIPFSWPFLAAFPIMLGIILALSHGGAFEAWWRRLPPVRSVGWLFASFLALTAAGAVIAHLPTAAALAVMAAAGLVNARAWYGVALLAARMHPRPHESVPARVLFGLPSAPLAALLVLALVVGVARLLFTGTIALPVSTSIGSPPSARRGRQRLQRIGRRQSYRRDRVGRRQQQRGGRARRRSRRRRLGIVVLRRGRRAARGAARRARPPVLLSGARGERQAAAERAGR